MHDLRGRGLDVICLDARHARAALKMQMNKTGRNDAEGLAQIMRTGWYRSVHVKSLDAHRACVLLGARAQLVGMTTRLSNHVPLDTTRRHSTRPVEVEHRAIGSRHGRTQYIADPLAPSTGAARQRAEARVTELEAALAAAHGTIRILTAQAERMARETREAVEARRTAEARTAALERQAALTPDSAGAQEPRTLTGAELRAREARGWTQAEVGRRAGVWQALVSLIERDKAAGWNVETVQRALTAV